MLKKMFILEMVTEIFIYKNQKHAYILKHYVLKLSTDLKFIQISNI